MKLELGVRSQESGGKSQKEEGKSQKAGARISVFTNMRCSRLTLLCLPVLSGFRSVDF
ncbi:hypothetical protein QUA79_08855 [Microcoleus sp. F8-D1]